MEDGGSFFAIRLRSGHHVAGVPHQCRGLIPLSWLDGVHDPSSSHPRYSVLSRRIVPLDRCVHTFPVGHEMETEPRTRLRVHTTRQPVLRSRAVDLHCQAVRLHHQLRHDHYPSVPDPD